MFKSLGKKFKIEKSNLKLQAYFGKINHPIGKTVLPIKINNDVYHEEFIIIDIKTVP